MDFATKLRKQIAGGAASFAIVSELEKRTYYFSLVPQSGFSTLMVGDVFNDARRQILDGMKPFGVVVNGKFYKFYGGAYIFSLENADLDEKDKAFFSNTLGGVFDGFLAKIVAKIRKHLEGFTEKTVPVSEKDKEYIDSYADASAAVASGARPVFNGPKLDYEFSGDMTAIDYLLGGEEFLESVYAKIISGGDTISSIYQDYYNYLVLARLFDEKMKKLTPADVATQKINAALAEAEAMGASNVRLVIAGRDSNLYRGLSDDFKDFSIEGKEIEGKTSVRHQFDLDGMTTFCFEYISPVLKDYRGRKVDYLRHINSLDVLRVVYGRKVLYEKSA